MSVRSPHQRGAIRPDKAALALLILAFVCLGVMYSVATPIFEASDELWHYPVIHHLARGGGLPVQDSNSVQLWRQEGSQPPLYYALGALLTAWIDTSDLPQVRQLNPHADIGVLTADGNVNMVVHTERERFPYHGTTLAVHIVRWMSVLMGAVTVWFTYLIARAVFVAEVGKSSPAQYDTALLAAALVAFNPMFLFISGSVNNDNLVVMLSTLALYLLARLDEGSLRFSRLVPLGLVIGLAVLSKVNALALIPLAVLALAWVAWRRRSWWLALWGSGTVVGATAVVAGWWFVRNAQLYGDPLGLNMLVAITGPRHPQPTLWQLAGEWQGFLLSFWGLFGGLNVPLEGWIYTFYNALSVLGLLGLVVFVWRCYAGRLPRSEGAPPSRGGGILRCPFAVPSLFLRYAQDCGSGLWLRALATKRLLRSLWVQRSNLWVGGRSMGPCARLDAHKGLCYSGHCEAHQCRSRALSCSEGNLSFTDARDASPAAQHDGIEGGVSFPMSGAPTRRGAAQHDAGLPLPTKERKDKSCPVVGWRLFLLVVWLGAVFASLVRWTLMTPASQGRLMFSALAPVGVLLALGLKQFAPARYWRMTIFALAVALVAVAAVIPFRVIAPAYARPQPLSPAEVEAIPNRLGVLFGDRIRLMGYWVDKDVVSPDDTLSVTLYWEGLAPIERDYSVFVHLLGEHDLVIAQRDTYPGRGLWPTSLWKPGEVIADAVVLNVPQSAYAPDRAQIEVGMYDFSSGHRLRAVQIPSDCTGPACVVDLGDNVRFHSVAVQPVTTAGKLSVGVVPNPVRFDFEGKLTLIGYSLDRRAARPGESLVLTLYWQALQPLHEDYTVFTHVLGKKDAIWAQKDSQPQDGAAPTSSWPPGAVVEDRYELRLRPDTPPDIYAIEVGLYRAATGQRLGVLGEQGRLSADHVILTRVRVLP